MTHERRWGRQSGGFAGTVLGPTPITSGVKIWIDLDNTPHVPFFIPIIRELTSRQHKVILTARDAFQVCELADRKGLAYVRIGRHYGKRLALKVYGTIWRSAQLLSFCLRQKPDLALSHGSRAQTLVSNILGVPSVAATDYEHSRTLPLAQARWLIASSALSSVKFRRNAERIRYYRGIKEDVYAPEA